MVGPYIFVRAPENCLSACGDQFEKYLDAWNAHDCTTKCKAQLDEACETGVKQVMGTIASPATEMACDGISEVMVDALGPEVGLISGPIISMACSSAADATSGIESLMSHDASYVCNSIIRSDSQTHHMKGGCVQFHHSLRFPNRVTLNELPKRSSSPHENIWISCSAAAGWW